MQGSGDHLDKMMQDEKIIPKKIPPPFRRFVLIGLFQSGEVVTHQASDFPEVVFVDFLDAHLCASGNSSF